MGKCYTYLPTDSFVLKMNKHKTLIKDCAILSYDHILTRHRISYQNTLGDTIDGISGRLL